MTPFDVIYDFFLKLVNLGKSIDFASVIGGYEFIIDLCLALGIGTIALMIYKKAVPLL